MIFKRIRGLLVVQDEFQLDSLTEFAIGDVVEVVVDRRRGGAERVVGDLIGIRYGHINVQIGQDIRSLYYNDILILKNYESESECVSV